MPVDGSSQFPSSLNVDIVAGTPEEFSGDGGQTVAENNSMTMSGGSVEEAFFIGSDGPESPVFKRHPPAQKSLRLSGFRGLDQLREESLIRLDGTLPPRYGRRDNRKKFMDRCVLSIGHGP
jgi:hypothetical protein